VECVFAILRGGAQRLGVGGENDGSSLSKRPT
jgi:hypothetical protein